MNSSHVLRIHEIIRLIPYGKVVTYGQVANLVGGCNARMVGHAASLIPLDSTLPWQRVINSKGAISPRNNFNGQLIQQKLLESEGIKFNKYGKIKIENYRWHIE